MSRSPETSQSPEYLDPREAAEWFPYTFYFSQGDQTLYHYIFHFLKKKMPSKTIDVDFEREIRRHAGPEIAALALSVPNQGIEKSDVPKTITDELQDWRAVFNGGRDWIIKEAAYGEFLERLLEKIISRDYEWYFTKKEEEKERSPGPLNDKHLSHVVHYIIHAGSVTSPGGNPKFELAGLPKIFQKMFYELRQILIAILRIQKRGIKLSERQDAILMYLRSVIDAYNKNHPNTPASLDDLFKE